MVRYRRNFVPGGTYFFTATLSDRRSTILVDHIAVLRHAFRIARRERPFSIDAIVVLPEHMHVVMTLPSADADYPGRWRRIKGLFSHRVAKIVPVERNKRGEYLLWQSRFWEHTIRDDADFERHVDYIHYNPVKHALVARVLDWPASSFHYYVRAGILAHDWGGESRTASQGFGERAV
jgi:putative transposase